MTLHFRHPPESTRVPSALALPGHPALRLGSLTRPDVERLYDEGRDAVIDLLLELDRHFKGAPVAPEPADGHRLNSPELPERLDPVTLITPSGERIPARVHERHGDDLVLAAVIPVAPFTAHELHEMILEHAVPEGRVQLRGRITCPDRRVPEVLHAESLCAVDVLQQRKFFRVQAARTAHILVAGQSEPTETATVNVGAGGCLLKGPCTLTLGEQLDLEIALLPGEPPIRARGRVVRKDPHGLPGVAFDSIDSVDRRRLVRFVSDQRLAEGFGPG